MLVDGCHWLQAYPTQFALALALRLYLALKLQKGDKSKVLRRQRRYTGVNQFFHNYEHDPQGRTHCRGGGQHPYSIRHSNGKHIISSRTAVGHGRGGKPQAFRFTKRLGSGYNMASGVRI